ncbi:MAG: N-acetylmuramoyl-L-alanine amidase [Firmicutes bacterium]|nr:N-acetylmuramoyl-L-alanine amidase [Bacillota bacterium]
MRTSCMARMARARVCRTVTWLALAMSPAALVAVPQVLAAENPTVVVDPGHGGVDGGTSGHGVLEKQIALTLAHELRQSLEQAGIRVVMTRTQDTDVASLRPSAIASRHKRDLQNRLIAIRLAAAQAAVSIHLNFSQNASDRGPIVLYAPQSDSSRAFAQAVAQAINRVAGSTQRPVARGHLFLLRHSPCPTILVEAGFLSNADDVDRLRSRTYQLQFTHALAHGVVQFVRKAAPRSQAVGGERDKHGMMMQMDF